MKKFIFTLGLAFITAACSTEELTENSVQTATDKESVEKSDSNRSLNRPISVKDPVVIGPNELIERSRNTGQFRRTSGSLLRTTPFDPLFTRGHLLEIIPSTGLNFIVAYEPRNDRWGNVGTINSGSNRPALGLVQNLNRWHNIDGEFYFLSSSFRQGGIAKWLRVIPGRPMNTGNLEEVAFTDRVPRSIAAVNSFDQELKTLIKKNIITASSDENEDLGFLFGSFENTIRNILPLGYENLVVKVDARSFGGASIKSVSLFINGKFVRTDRESPFEWGIGANAAETLNLSSATFGTTHTIRARIEDTEGRVTRTGKLSVVVDRRVDRFLD